jgi:hypothetical protein
VWFAGILTDTDTEQAVDYDQFEQTQSRTQKLPELDQASSPLPEQDLPTLTTSKAKSYYKTIQGVRYDRSLLEAAEERISGQGDGRISEMDAEEIVELSKDGKGITETELRTLKYISENYHFTPKAAVWFASILTDTEQAVDYDQFEQTQSRTQKLPELDQV